MAVIRFQNVSKAFSIHSGQMVLRDRILNILRRSRAQRFFALRDVSFSIERGDSLAIIGHNGAGKSTLLNIATSLCQPTSGTVEVNGRIAALLELGAGFHPDLTGAENVRINGALMGLTRADLK
jgi:ABC-type polysaccharide/polyol phosphate transport system ATPase subunit